jgi:hypothetical protein
MPTPIKNQVSPGFDGVVQPEAGRCRRASRNTFSSAAAFPPKPVTSAISSTWRDAAIHGSEPLQQSGLALGADAGEFIQNTFRDALEP